MFLGRRHSIEVGFASNPGRRTITIDGVPVNYGLDLALDMISILVFVHTRVFYLNPKGGFGRGPK